MLSHKNRFFDLRNIKLAIVVGDPLGEAFGVSAFHRCQIHNFIKRQLIPYTVENEDQDEDEDDEDDEEEDDEDDEDDDEDDENENDEDEGYVEDQEVEEDVDMLFHIKHDHSYCIQ